MGVCRDMAPVSWFGIDRPMNLEQRLLRASRRQSDGDMEPLRVQRAPHLFASMLTGRLPRTSRFTRRSPVVHGLTRPKRSQPNHPTPDCVNSDTANYLRAAPNGRVAQPRATSPGQPNFRIIIAIMATHSQSILQFCTSANHATFPFSSRGDE